MAHELASTVSERNDDRHSVAGSAGNETSSLVAVTHVRVRQRENVVGDPHSPGEAASNRYLASADGRQWKR